MKAVSRFGGVVALAVALAVAPFAVAGVAAAVALTGQFFGADSSNKAWLGNPNGGIVD